MVDRGVQAGGQNGRPRESSVEVSLAKVPLEKLMRLLQSIERSPGVVRVRRLRLRKSPEIRARRTSTRRFSSRRSVRCGK